MMNEEIKSVLRFENYIVKKVLFEYNLQYNNEEAIDIKFDVDADYCVNEEDGSMQVTLETYVFNGEDKTKYPFSMEMEVVGFFSISNVSEEQIENFKPNAVAILFPYVRALISSYTANANVTPLILPPINVNQLLRSKK
ncbi:hypothetical protein D7V82_05915 [bacterium 1xD8-6]|nr:hypothetical protein D7V72_07370 [bacterium D16-36]RKI71434.1 hypothetical protein D7V82_05915 [bacterium 1xD8-6]